MKNLNLCQFIGRLGKDIELRAMPSGEYIGSFSLAVQDDYKSKSGEKVEKTEWVRFSVFGKSAEILAQYAHKGDKLYVSGSMTSRKYTDKTTGIEREITEIRVGNFELLSPKGDAPQQAPQRAPQRQAAPVDDFDDGLDIHF